MWTINGKPTLRKALNDAKKTVEHCRGLNDADLASLNTLYSCYDRLSGRITPSDLSPLNSIADVIGSQYPKTYGKDVLSYIRADLMKGVHRCPMCSLLNVTELDHFWNQSQYGQLAVCRLNLVPICGKCNKGKSDKSANDFVHAYYQQFPDGVVFLKANCRIVNGRIIPRFVIDSSGLADAELARRLNRQIVEIRLRSRLRGASEEFIRTLFQGTTFRSDRVLSKFLQKRETENIAIFGLNDWRTALVRGICQCPGMNIQIVMNYRRSTAFSRDGKT